MKQKCVLNEKGMTTVAYVLATGLSLILLTWCTLFVLASYSRAIIRGSSERASRAAIVEFTNTENSTFAINRCIEVFKEELSISMPGNLSKDLSANCSISADHASIRVFGTLPMAGTTFSPISIDETTSRKLER